MLSKYLFSLIFIFCTIGTTIHASAPGPFACPDPINLHVGNVTDSSAILTWDAAPGAALYEIEVEDEQNNPSNFHLETNSVSNAYTVTGLTPGVLYKFKVRTRCSNGDKSDWAEWVYFTASNGGGGNGPCTSPTGLSVSVSNDTLMLSWNAVSGALQYFIEVEDEQNNPSNFHLLDSTNTNSLILTGLSQGVLYKFKVKTQCTGGNSGWSNWHYFTGNGNIGGGGNNGNGNSCGAPTGLNLQNLTATSVTLAWTAVPGAISYTVEIEREKKNAAPWEMTLSAATNNLDLTGLDPNTRYKFKVRSVCSPGQHSGWSKRAQFKTPVSILDDATEDREERPSQASTQTNTLSLEVWPNPVRLEAQLTIGLENEGAVDVQMFNLNGQSVYRQSITAPAGKATLTVPVYTLPAGMYVLQARHAQEMSTVKVVVQQ